MIDCFPFFNELDLLEIRLNSLAPYIERFVLCESTRTFSGNTKPLYFEENKDRYKDFNITHLIEDGGMTKDAGKNKGDAWRRENYQREFLMNGLVDVDPETMILISDLDEIPNLEGYNCEEGVFRQKLYYYYLNCFTGMNRWHGTIAVRRKNIPTLNILRDNRDKMPIAVGNGGWHFSTLGTPENIVYKIESFAHIELNIPNVKDKISYNQTNLIDPYHRNPRKYAIEMPSGPKWLLENKDRYKHLFYEEDK